MDDLISINLTIGDRRYPLKIRTAEEPLVREAERLINEKFNEFQLRFTGQEKIDYLAMSALMNLVDVLKQHSQENESTDDVMKKLSEAEAMLNESLRRN